MTRGMWCAAVVLGALALGCGEQGRGAPLAFEGAGTIGTRILPGLIQGHVRRGGRPFSRVGDIGTARGFEAVMAGRAPLGGMSRSLRSSEKALQPFYAIIGYDALAVFVNKDLPVQTLTRAQLKALFGGRVKRWSEVGGPDAPVELVTQELHQGSGTADFFREAVLEGAAFAPTTLQPNFASCLEYVARHRHAITWGSLSGARPTVRVLPLEGVAPGADTIRSADYPLSRPLILYSKGVPAGELKDFFDYVLSPEGQAIVATRFVPLRDAAAATR